MARGARVRRRWRRPSHKTLIVIGVGVAAAAVAVSAFIIVDRTSAHARSATAHRATTTDSVPTASTPAASPTTASTTSTTTPNVPGTAGPGFNAGQVTAVGDSVMLDYEDPLKSAIPGVNVDAAVSRQWSDGETILQTLKAGGQLGADVIVGLGTNGPISDSDFDAMMSILGGASRVVFVNVHVDRPWQDPNNAVLAQGAQRYPNVVVADWATLAAQNPQWFGADGTHLAIDGPGANALANLVATTLANG
jgi:hypothetical protein